jgi:hypothetical protein
VGAIAHQQSLTRSRIIAVEACMQLLRRVRVVAIAAVALLSLTTAALAHHSFALYEHTRT